MTFIATFIVLAIGGIIDAGYLYYEHVHKNPLVCPLDQDCNVVIESRWATTLGLRNETLGLVYYILLFIGILLSLFLLEQRSILLLLLLIATAGGLVYSVFLTWLQVRVIKNFCFYCLISATLSLLLFLNSIYLWSTL